MRSTVLCCDSHPKLPKSRDNGQSALPDHPPGERTCSSIEDSNRLVYALFAPHLREPDYSRKCDVLADLETFLAKLVPENSQLYRHSAEGLDDMPGHIRTMLTRTSETIPIVQGRLALGTWQGIYLWEHRRATQKRELLVHVSGL
jgi:hypothetical protein